MSPSLPPRAPGRLAGPTRTTLPSVRPAWTSLPAGLAQCHWSTHRWGWTLSSSKTKCPYWGRNTGTLRGYNLSWPRPSPRLFGHGERGGAGRGQRVETTNIQLVRDCTHRLLEFQMKTGRRGKWTLNWYSAFIHWPPWLCQRPFCFSFSSFLPVGGQAKLTSPHIYSSISQQLEDSFSITGL